MFGGPGEVKLGAFCASEPEAGSDVGAIRTRAAYDARVQRGVNIIGEATGQHFREAFKIISMWFGLMCAAP